MALPQESLRRELARLESDLDAQAVRSLPPLPLRSPCVQSFRRMSLTFFFAQEAKGGSSASSNSWQK